MSYSRALARIRALRLAQAAIEDALAVAIEDAMVAAEAEGRLAEAEHMVQGSGTRQRVDGSDIERHLRRRWLATRTEEERDAVRRTARDVIASGGVDRETAERLMLLTA